MSARCKSCGAAIRWAVTPLGKAMPVDETPDPRGMLQLERQGAKLIVVEIRAQLTLISDSEPDSNSPEDIGFAPVQHAPLRPNLPRYTSHFATCPHAARHRKVAR